LALFLEAGIKLGSISTYEVGFVIGPRLNAMGRLEHALDSLRLLCTTDINRAHELARLLDDTNRSRQDLTLSSTQKALSGFRPEDPPPLIVAADVSYDEGVVGLVAAKLVEHFYRPALVITIGPEVSKGSARSVTGFHITDFLRRHASQLSSVGGHAMAAGFSLPTARLEDFISEVQTASKAIDTSLFVRQRRVDAVIPLELLDMDLFRQLEQFAPFGLGNPRPVFASEDVGVSGAKRLGKDFAHLKFFTSGFESIYFQAPPGLVLPPRLQKIIYSLDLNTYNGFEKLQLLVKEVHGSA
jgi:single-stranded-DNA-specific exonuclease